MKLKTRRDVGVDSVAMDDEELPEAFVIDAGTMAGRVVFIVVVDWLVTSLFVLLANILVGIVVGIVVAIVVAMLSALIPALLAGKGTRTRGFHGSQFGFPFVSNDICLRRDVS
jgi:hypothetical protein